MNGNHHSKMKDIDDMTSLDGDIRSGKSSPDDTDALNLTSTTPPASTAMATPSSPPLLVPFHSSDPCPSGSPTNAAMASVQAALAALQAGQMSLNQVSISPTFYAQLTPVAPQSVRTQSSHQYLFTFLGSTYIKAVHM